MTRKQREANVRRAMAAGRRRGPMPESVDVDLLHHESLAGPEPIDAREATEGARAAGLRGA